MTQYRIIKNNQYNVYTIEHKYWWFWHPITEHDGHGGDQLKQFANLNLAENYCWLLLQPEEKKPLTEVVKYIPEFLEF